MSFLELSSSAVFERNKDKQTQVIIIENIKAVFNGTCPLCNGNFVKDQLEAFTQNQVITFEYCDHSIKAKWKFK